MSTDRRLGRYLGTAFLTVLAGSLVSGVLRMSMISGPTAEALESIAENPAEMRWSTMVELGVTSVGIVVLAVLLYTVVRSQNPIASIVGLGWWLAEAVTLAVSTIGMFLLIPVSEAYLEADASASPHLLSLGDTLIGFQDVAYGIHMVFFALGGLVWYSLMYQLRCVPRWLSLFGIAAVALALIATLGSLAADLDLFILGVPTGLFEITIGIWLIVKGISKAEAEAELVSA